MQNSAIDMLTSYQSLLDQAKYSGKTLDMTRGKPSDEQIDLSRPLLQTIAENDSLIRDGVSIANYGGLDGLQRARQLFGEILGVDASQVLIGGNSSLMLEYTVLAQTMLFGACGQQPWSQLSAPPIWLCPVPGYDRHFAMTENFGFELKAVPLTGEGIDLSVAAPLIEENPQVKGVWIVPRYSNPTGETYSKKTIEALASLKPAAPDFYYYLDNAYVEHHLSDSPDELVNIYEAFERAGTQDHLLLFTSTSKMTFPGAGISAVAGSPATIERIRKQTSYMTIGFNKINQARHLEFFGDITGLRAHMKRHAELLKPKFDLVDQVLSEHLVAHGLASITRPRGGYFVSCDLCGVSAEAVVALAADHGLKLTPAGSTYPYRHDPFDANIRIAPSTPPLEDLRDALMLFCACVHKVAQT